MNKYIISVRNTANGKYENVEVTEEVYKAYMRTGWNIKDNDESFFKHQIQFSALLGNIDDAAENFKEFLNIKSDTEEIAEMNIRLEMLFKALRKLSSDESETAFRKGDETQEDNDTSAQPQTQAMGAALCCLLYTSPSPRDS